MRTIRRALTLASVSLLAVVALTGTAQADIYLPDHPNAPESTCSGSFRSEEASCTLPAIGEHYAVGAHGSGLVRIVLEAPPERPGLPAEVIVDCWLAVAAGGCVGAASGGGYPAGTTLTCRAYGSGSADFECSNFLIEG